MQYNVHALRNALDRFKSDFTVQIYVWGLRLCVWVYVFLCVYVRVCVLIGALRCMAIEAII